MSSVLRSTLPCRRIRCRKSTTISAAVADRLTIFKFSRYIAADIGGSDKTVWMSQAIVIVTVVLGPPASQAADYFGRKWLLAISSCFGVVGAIIVSRATSMGMAIGGQSIESVAYIGQPILIAVASEILPRKFRPIAQGGLNAAGAAGAIVGILGGSALTSSSISGWRFQPLSCSCCI